MSAKEIRMLQWNIGAVKITRVVENHFDVPSEPDGAFIPGATPRLLRQYPWLYPHFVSEDDHLQLSVHALLIDAPGIRVIVDTCLGNDKPRRALGDQSQSTRFLQDMEEVGWSRDSVDCVICTHMHADHVGWNTLLQDGAWVPTFPNARYLFGREELAHVERDFDEEADAILRDSIKPIFDHGLAELVETNHRLSPEIHLIPTLGHTLGHVSVMIESEGARAVITGDMAHHPCQMAHPELCSIFDADPEQSVATRRRMFDAWCEDETLVIGTHFAAPTAGRMRTALRNYRFEA